MTIDRGIPKHHHPSADGNQPTKQSKLNKKIKKKKGGGGHHEPEPIEAPGLAPRIHHRSQGPSRGGGPGAHEGHYQPYAAGDRQFPNYILKNEDT
jgi:hypothetical protein